MKLENTSKVKKIKRLKSKRKFRNASKGNFLKRNLDIIKGLFWGILIILITLLISRGLMVVSILAIDFFELSGFFRTVAEVFMAMGIFVIVLALFCEIIRIASESVLKDKKK